MNKKVKILSIALAVAFGLGGLGIWYAASLVDQLKLTQLLSALVKEATGRELKISGPVSLTFFPSIGVVAEDISLSNARWVSDSEMLKVKRVELDIKLLPLFSKRVEISRISLSNVNVHLQSNSAGIGNWILTAPLAQGDPGQTSFSGDSGRDGDTFVAIENVNVTDARIRYQGSSGSENIYQIARLSLRGNEGSTTIKLDAKQGDIQMGIDGKVTAIRKIVDDWGRHPLNIEMDMNFELNGKTLAVKGTIKKEIKAIPSFDLHLSSQSFDLAPLSGASAFAATGGKLPAHIATPHASSPYLFSNTPLPFNLLPEASGLIDISINQLGLSNYAPMKNVTALLQFQKDEINLQNLNFQLGSGSAQAQGSIAKFHSATPTVSLKGQAKGYTLEQILKVSDASTKVSGGDTRIAFNLTGNGTSLHQLAASSTGKVQISIDQARLPSNYINQGGDFMISLFDVINPLRKKSNQTVLECAVAYLPVSNGLVNVVDSMGVETDRLDVVLSGTVNLNTEAINLNIYPREKSGLTTGLDLANLIKLQGTLQNPSAGINKAGIVNSAVSIGLGFLTGGATILAENAKSMATKSQPCKAALHSWSDIYPAIQ